MPNTRSIGQICSFHWSRLHDFTSISHTFQFRSWNAQNLRLARTAALQICLLDILRNTSFVRSSFEKIENPSRSAQSSQFATLDCLCSVFSFLALGIKNNDSFLHF
jgi:hypothetical protein